MFHSPYVHRLCYMGSLGEREGGRKDRKKEGGQPGRVATMSLTYCTLKIGEPHSPFIYTKASQASMYYIWTLRKLAWGKLLGGNEGDFWAGLQLYVTLTFLSHNSSPQETHPLRNWMKSSWTFSKPASYQLPREADIPPPSNASSEAFRRRAVEGNPPWECCS